MKEYDEENEEETFDLDGWFCLCGNSHPFSFHAKLRCVPMGAVLGICDGQSVCPGYAHSRTAEVDVQKREHQ